jgi:hypothetical protein
VIVRPRGLVELTVEGDDPEPMLGVAREIVTELRSAVDWPASAVSVGAVHQVLPTASDAILLTLAANRLPSIDRVTFAKYWLDTRATDLAESKRTSYDGVLQCALAKVAALPHLTVPGFAEVIAKDKQNFADPSAAMLGAFMRTLPRRATT